jgi:hypothetical protein
MKKLINLTPHDIVIVGDDKTRTIPKSGSVARLDVTSKCCGYFDGIALTSTAYGPVIGLPDYQPDTLLVVSAMVRSAAVNRPDLASPGELVRDEKGSVIGCKNLIVN